MPLASAPGPGRPHPRTSAQAWQRHPCYGRGRPLELVHRGEPCTRLVVVAAHPDDESLGAGGLIASAAAAGLAVYVVLLTAGEASPYANPEQPRHALARVRIAETENALARLAPDHFLAFLGVPDGEVASLEAQVARSLTDLLGDATRTLVAAPWRHDGHPDHDASGRAAATATAASGARLLEYPLLAWTRRTPAELPWSQVRHLDLDERLRATKSAAIDAHESQVLVPRGERQPPPLSDRALEHFRTGVEHYLEASPSA